MRLHNFPANFNVGSNQISLYDVTQKINGTFFPASILVCSGLVYPDKQEEVAGKENDWKCTTVEWEKVCTLVWKEEKER